MSSFTYRQGMTRSVIPRRVKTVVVEEGVTRIEDYAFDSNLEDDICFDELESVEIATTVEWIGHYSFDSCGRLSNVLIKGDSARPSSLRDLGEAVFARCGALKMIDLSNCPLLTLLDVAAFRECSSLQTILLPPNLQCIGHLCFTDCTAMAKIRLPKSLDEIRSGAFEGCVKLEFLILPESLAALDSRAFRDCKSLTCVQFKSFVSVGSVMGHIQAGFDAKIFQKCVSLHSIQWPHKSYPISWWPRIISTVLSTSQGRGLLPDEDQAQNRRSCFYSSLCEHLEEILQQQPSGAAGRPLLRSSKRPHREGEEDE